MMIREAVSWMSLASFPAKHQFQIRYLPSSRARTSEVVPVYKVGPDSSYFSFENHIRWNVHRNDTREPAIQVEYCALAVPRLNLILEGAGPELFDICSPIPAHIVVPSDGTLLHTGSS
jgi:hypothetical protein